MGSSDKTRSAQLAHVIHDREVLVKVLLGSFLGIHLKIQSENDEENGSSIYYMPYCARQIIRLNPDNDTLSSVGDDLGQEGDMYSGTVVGNDDCVYGIHFGAK